MRSRIAGLLALAVLTSAGCAVTANAQPYGRGSWDRSAQRDAYENGYRQGAHVGERDARAGRRYDYRHDSAYRNADRGYDRRWGSRGQYRQAYRDGFERGYRDAYQRRSAYGRRRGPYDGYGDPGSYGDYDRRNRGYGYGAAGAERGFTDGYSKGREDARDGDRFDPRRHKWYREGDRGYDRDYGSRDAYTRVYRDAFVQGYERGYQEARGGYRGDPRY